MDCPLSNDASRVCRVNNLLDAKRVSGSDGVHQSPVVVLELVVELLLFALGLGLLQFPSMADFDTTIEGQTPPFTTRPGDTHDRVSAGNHDAARNPVDPSSQDIENGNRRRDIRLG